MTMSLGKKFGQKIAILSNFVHYCTSDIDKFATILHFIEFRTILIYNDFSNADRYATKAPRAEAIARREREEDKEETDIITTAYNYKY